MDDPTRPRQTTPDDAEFQAWKAKRTATPKTPDDAEFQSWKDMRALKSTQNSTPIKQDLSDLRHQSESTAVRGKGPVRTEGPNTAESLISGLAQSLTLGSNDEILGGVEAGRKLLTGDTNVRQNYRTARNAVREHDAAGARANPKTHMAASLVGSALPIFFTGGAAAPAVEATTGSRVASAVLQGAKYGAVQGAGDAEELSDIPGDVVSGGLKGGAAGGALHAAGSAASGLGKVLRVDEGISKLSNWASKQLPEGRVAKALETLGVSTGKAGEANRTINRRVAQAGEDVGDIKSRVFANIEQSGDRPEILGDYSKGARKLTKAVTKRPGAGQAQIEQAIGDRSSLTRERVADDIASATGHGDDVIPRMETNVRQRATDAQAAFSRTAREAVDDPKVQEILSRPTFQELYADARRMAADEGRELPTKTVQEMSPDLQEMLDDAAAKGHNTDTMRAAFEAQGLLKSREVPVPDVETIHYIEKALNDRIETGFGGAKAAGKNKAASLRGGFDTLRQRVAELVPEFEDAMQKYAEQSGVINAGDIGLNALSSLKKAPKGALGKGDPRALASTRTGVRGLEQAAKGMSTEEREAFRLGGGQALMDKLDSVPATKSGSTDPALRVVKDSPARRRLLDVIVGSPERSDRLHHALGRERTMSATNDILGGSDTALNLAEGDALAKTGLFGKLMHPVQAVRGGTAKLVDEGVTNRNYEALGDRLGASGTAEIQRVLAELDAALQGQGFLGSAGNLTRNSLARYGAQGGAQ